VQSATVAGISWVPSILDGDLRVVWTSKEMAECQTLHRIPMVWPAGRLPNLQPTPEMAALAHSMTWSHRPALQLCGRSVLFHSTNAPFA